MTINEHIKSTKDNVWTLADDIFAGHLRRVEEAGISLKDFVRICGDIPDTIPIEAFEESGLKYGVVMNSIGRLAIVEALNLPKNLEEETFLLMAPDMIAGKMEFTPIESCMDRHSIRTHEPSLAQMIIKKLDPVLMINKGHLDLGLEIMKCEDMDTYKIFHVRDKLHNTYVYVPHSQTSYKDLEAEHKALNDWEYEEDEDIAR